MTLNLPNELANILGPQPERKALEAVALLLVTEGKISVGKAGELLGLDRLSAIQWYTSHGLPYPDLDADDLAEDLGYAAGGKRVD